MAGTLLWKSFRDHGKWREKTRQKPNDPRRQGYLGLEYDIIGIEKATTLSQRKHEDILTCLRSSKMFADGRAWRPRSYSTTNPGGVGHEWYKSRFVAPWRQQRETETRFFPARAGDNPFNNPEYAKILENLTGWQRRAWCDGDWDIAAGQYFTKFRRETHVMNDFDDGRGLDWFAAMDYGYTHYTVVMLGCKDGDGNLFVVDDYAERRRLPQIHAQSIHGMLARHGIGKYAIRLRQFVAGADVFSRQSDGTTVAAQYAQLGISLKCANTDRIQGWAEMLRGFGDPEGGVAPRLFVHRRCGRLIECLGMLQHDPHRPEDVLKVDADEDGNGGDDAADALRYLVASKTRAVTQRKLRGV
jgi:phage terminase large subunit